MKIIYTILFFADTLLLMILAFLLLKMIDNGINAGKLIIMLIGISLSIILLVYFLRLYLKAPSSNSHNRF